MLTFTPFESRVEIRASREVFTRLCSSMQWSVALTKRTCLTDSIRRAKQGRGRASVGGRGPTSNASKSVDEAR